VVKAVKKMSDKMSKEGNNKKKDDDLQAKRSKVDKSAKGVKKDQDRKDFESSALGKVKGRY
jgi:hypothetical protein